MSLKRILIFSLAYYPVEGGAEIAVKEITNRIPEAEFDMVTLRFDRTHPEKERIGNCTVYRIKSSKILFPIEAFFMARKLHNRKPYDAIWSIMAARAGAAAMFFKYSFPRVSYILTLQEGDPIEYMKSRAMYWVNPLFRKIFIKADLVQAISNYLADYAQIMGYRGKVEVIPNGVDVGKFQIPSGKLQKDKNTIKLITTSRLVQKNAVRDIIDALKFLPKNVSLDIVGTGPLEKSLKLLADSLELQNRVQFLGHIPYENIPKYLHGADIFIRPSLSEGLGNSFIEAMAAGLPVIATPIGGITDFLKDGETGLFCEVQNPENIAKQVIKIMNDDNLRQKLIVNGLKLAKEQYDWDLVAKEMKSRVFDRV